MKHSIVIALLVVVSLRLSAQVETTEARQNTSGQVNSAQPGKGTKVHGKTKAGEEGKVTTQVGTDTSRGKMGSGSNMSGQTSNGKGSQKGKTHSTKKATNVKQTDPSKNANNRNGSKTSSSTTTSGSGKKDM